MKRDVQVVLFSGGLDSTLALHWALPRGPVHTLQIDYEGRPKRERVAANRILRRLRPSCMHAIRLGFDPRRDDKIRAYLAGRNLLFHAAAQSLGEAVDAARVVAGHLPEDAQGFPDAKPGYFRKIQELAQAGRPDARAIPIVNPLGEMDILAGVRALPFPPDWTWSCWRDVAKPCGRCDKCRRRQRLLTQLGRRTSGARTPS